MVPVPGSALVSKTTLPLGKEPGKSGSVADEDLSKLPSALSEAAPAVVDAGEGGEGEDKGRPKRQSGGVWHEVGRTDWMRGNNHPVFEKKVEIPFFPAAVQVCHWHVDLVAHSKPRGYTNWMRAGFEVSCRGRL